MVSTLHSDNVFRTSTGVGHHYRPGYYFPSSNFKDVTRNALPPTLAVADEISSVEHFRTSSGVAHDTKYLSPPLQHEPHFRLGADCYRVHYIKDLHEKLQRGGFRKPLTMGNQTSEMHANYRNQPPLETSKEFVVDPQRFKLRNHHTNGASKKVEPFTNEPKINGKTFYPNDQGVYNLNDTYLTTTNKVHRRFKPKELNGTAKKNITTYWECEEYPKSETWGHGLHANPLQKASVPRAAPPMRNENIFKDATKIRRVVSGPPVPHRGLKSLYAESFSRPADVKAASACYAPHVPIPFVQTAPSHVADNRSAFSAPHMYRTEAQIVGSQKYPTV